MIHSERIKDDRRKTNIKRYSKEKEMTDDRDDRLHVEA